MLDKKEFLNAMNNLVSTYKECKVFESSPEIYYDLCKDLEPNDFRNVIKDIIANEDYFPNPRKFRNYILKNTDWLYKILFKGKNLKFFPSDFVSYNFLRQYQPDILEKAMNEIIRYEEEFPQPARILKYYHEIIIKNNYVKCPACQIYHDNKHSHYFLVKDFNKAKIRLLYIQDEIAIDELKKIVKRADEKFKDFIKNYLENKNIVIGNINGE